MRNGCRHKVVIAYGLGAATFLGVTSVFDWTRDHTYSVTVATILSAELVLFLIGRPCYWKIHKYTISGNLHRGARALTKGGRKDRKLAD